MSRINEEINSALPDDLEKLKNHLKQNQKTGLKLSDDFLKKVGVVWDILSSFAPLMGPKERFEESFLFETNPTNALKVWQRIAYFYYRFHQKYTNLAAMTVPYEQQLLAELIGFSTGNRRQPQFGQKIEEMESELIDKANRKKE